MSDIKKISIFGPFRDPTGYAHVVRGFAKTLYNNGWLVGLSDFPEWSGKRIEVEPIFDKLEQMAPVVDSDITLAFCLPEQIKHKSVNPNSIIINYTMFEADGICKDWAMWSSMSDYTMVPTKFNFDGWINSGVNQKRMIRVPIGIDVSAYNPDVQPIKLGTDTEEIIDRYKYRFLNIQEISDRKNVDALLKGWMVATKGVDDACLILKISSYTENRLDYFGKRVADIRAELGITKDEHAPIFVYGMMVKSEEIPAIISLCTHYISTSRGEGWDMSVAGAASMNKQIIVPRHTAYLDYLKYGKMIECDKVPADQGGVLSRLYKDLNWFEVRPESLVKQITESLSGDRHADNRQHMVDHHSWASATRKLEFAINEVRRKADSSAIKPFTKTEDKSKAVVMMACKSFGNPCGIAEYACSLYDALIEQKVNVGRMGGDDAQWMDHIDNNKVNVVHVQHEYQFHSPARLMSFLNQCKKRGVKTVLTQHTLSKRADEYNEVIRDYADVVVVHSDWHKYYAENVLRYKRVEVVPMPIGELYDHRLNDSLDDKAKLAVDRFKIGFFGFSYFHKGIDTLINAWKDPKLNNDALILFSSKPKQDIYDYAGQCTAMMEGMGKHNFKDYFWFDRYHSEPEILQYLSMCDMMVLPYKDYGSVGSSAAISLALRAGVPTMVSDSCWFKHVPGYKILSADALNRDKSRPVVFKGDTVADIINFKTFVVNNKEFFNNKWKDNLRVYSERNNFKESALCHMKKVYEIGT